jgi:hypothetical protein
MEAPPGATGNTGPVSPAAPDGASVFVARSLDHPLVQDRSRPFQGELAGGLQQIGQRRGRAQQRIHHVQRGDQTLVEQLQMARHAARAELDGIPLRALLLGETERRVPARARLKAG